MDEWINELRKLVINERRMNEWLYLQKWQLVSGYLSSKFFFTSICVHKIKVISIFFVFTLFFVVLNDKKEKGRKYNAKLIWQPKVKFLN